MYENNKIWIFVFSALLLFLSYFSIKHHRITVPQLSTVIFKSRKTFDLLCTSADLNQDRCFVCKVSIWVHCRDFMNTITCEPKYECIAYHNDTVRCSYLWRWNMENNVYLFGIFPIYILNQFSVSDQFFRSSFFWLLRWKSAKCIDSWLWNRLTLHSDVKSTQRSSNVE